MAHSESAALPDGVQMSSQLEEQIKSLIKSQIEEQIKPLITLITSLSERVNQEKPETSQSKVEVEGRVSRGLKNWERIAVIVAGLSVIVSAAWFLGGISSDVNGVREQNRIQFEAVDDRFDAMETQFKDIKDVLKRIDERLYNLEQKQTE